MITQWLKKTMIITMIKTMITQKTTIKTMITQKNND